MAARNDGWVDHPHTFPDRPGEEVTTPVVKEQRGQFGAARADREQNSGREGQDKDLPIQGYRQLTIPEIVSRIPSLSSEELREIRAYERAHRRRKTLLVRLERRLRDTHE